jgi:hypothetical protein
VTKELSFKFLQTYLVTLVLLICSAVVFNLIIDPFGVYHLVEINGINNIKTGQGNHVRMGKAGSVRVFKPQAVILGDSRAEYGINPEHPGWKAGPVYNLAISGSNVYEILRYFEHAHRIKPLKQVLFVLDFKQFNAYRINEEDFTESRLSETLNEKENKYYYLSDFISTTLSIKALAQSINTIWRSSLGKSATYLENGQRDWHNDLLFRTAMEKFGSYYNLFSEEEKSLFTERRKNRVPSYMESFLNHETRYYSFESFRHLVRIAIRDNVDLRLAISPSHARYFECFRLMGDWYLWEEWKRTLVRILEEEATKAGVKPFPLWDFSGFNTLTMELVPPPDDKKTHMKWYFESSHYTTDLGDLVQDRVFEYKEPGRIIPEFFGVLITGGNIESHLKNIRNDNLRFRELQPSVAKELAGYASNYELSDNYARDKDGNNITSKW